MLTTVRTLSPSRRRGFTIVEMLVTLAFMGLIAGAIIMLLWRQQRFYNSTTELLNTRGQIRQAAFMLPGDLRGISRPGGDIYAMSDSSIEFRAITGSSVVCANSTGAGAGKLSTVPVRLIRGNSLTNWKANPVVNDSVAFYDDSSSVASTDDKWRYSRITAFTTVTTNVASGCPTSTGLTQAGDFPLAATNASYQLTLSPIAPATVTVGAGMRFFRRVHYSLYRLPADNKWYLAYFDCLPNRVPVCNAPQPIAGPLRPYATDGTSGLEFTYYDSTGAVTANRALVARISVVARAQGEAMINVTGAGQRALKDSLRLEVALRNRN